MESEMIKIVGIVFATIVIAIILLIVGFMKLKRNFSSVIGWITLLSGLSIVVTLIIFREYVGAAAFGLVCFMFRK